MNKIILILLVCNQSIAMQVVIPIPPVAERPEVAEQILQHSGYRQALVHYDALYYAFEVMSKTPELPAAVAEKVEEQSLSPQPLERVKQVWFSYNKRNTLLAVGGTVPEIKLNTDAQELIASAIALMLTNKDTAIKSQIRQKYIIAGIGALATITSTVLAICLKSCP